MTQFIETSRKALLWVIRVMLALLRKRPQPTTFVIVVSFVNKVTRMLVFFLPLKVILLAASDGVPRYFQLFVDPERQQEWIIGLSVAAVLAYLLTLILDSYIEKTAASASSKLIADAHRMGLTNKQRERAGKLYAQFCGIGASTIFLLLGGAGLVWLNGTLAASLGAVVIASYTVAAMTVPSEMKFNMNRFQAFVLYKSHGYVQVSSGITFLAGFMVILAPYLQGEGGNILIAILSFLLLRQVIGAIAEIATSTVGLYQQRHFVFPLVYQSKKKQRGVTSEEQALERLFAPGARTTGFRPFLEEVFDPLDQVDSEWIDPSIRGVFSFRVMSNREDASEFCFLHRAFMSSSSHLLDNEDVLANTIDWERLPAPRRALEYQNGPFRCHVSHVGAWREIPAREWRDAVVALTVAVWSIRPRQALVDVYTSTTAMLHERLTDELVAKAYVAADRPGDEVILSQFRTKLPKVQAQVAELPLCIVNPDINRKNVVDTEDGPVALNWCRWRVEPAGFGRNGDLKRKELSSVVETVAARRKEFARDSLEGGILLTGEVATLEQQLLKMEYRAALSTMEKILEKY